MPPQAGANGWPLTAFSPDGLHLAVASADGRLKTYDTGWSRLCRTRHGVKWLPPSPMPTHCGAEAVHAGAAGSGRVVLNIAEDGRPAAERHIAVEVANPIFEQHTALAWVSTRLHPPHSRPRMHHSCLMIICAPLHGRYPLAAQQISWWSWAPRQVTSRPTAQAAASLCGVPQPSARGEYLRKPPAGCLHAHGKCQRICRRPSCRALRCINST